MNTGAPTADDTKVQVAQLQHLWAESAGGVLRTVAGFPITVEAETGEAVPAEAAGAGKPAVWARFATAQGLHGECALMTDEPGAVQLAQVLMSEPADAAAPYDQGHQEAFAELLRQIAGQVAIGLQAVAGGEVSLNLVASDAPSWPAAGTFGIRIGGEKLAAIRLAGSVSTEMAEALGAAHEAQERSAEPKNAPAQKPQIKQAAVAAPESSAAMSGSNLELLLDIKLSATIRFGQRRMLLREILEIHPGAAIELDRNVQDPVDLLVGGRVIARGEVVIVDGNYGLRILEIVSPQQRIALLEG